MKVSLSSTADIVAVVLVISFPFFFLGAAKSTLVHTIIFMFGKISHMTFESANVSPKSMCF